MLPRSRSVILAVVAFLVLAPLSLGTGIEYVGLRIGLPFGHLPWLVGIEVGTRLSFGWGLASLLVASDGRTLIVGSVDYVLGERGGTTEPAVRISLGLSYFDLEAPLPSPCFGGGVTCALSPFAGARTAVAAEVLYPIAFGPPLFTLGGGWSPQ